MYNIWYETTNGDWLRVGNTRREDTMLHVMDALKRNNWKCQIYLLPE